MTRKYDSRRRAESAERTRQTIVEAAVKLHGQGITILSAIAEEAGVSLPTVNKYFPTREDLFEACTGHVAANLEYPSPETLREIAHPGERLRRIVQEVFSLHEETIGQSWTGYKLEDDSPVMARAMANYEEFVARLAEAVPYENAAENRDIVTRFVRAALSPLSYRALRVKNGLGFEDAVKNMTLALAGVLNIEV
jgi:AcrR family transcriptional regulator